jgi:hypothetical protein
MRTAVKPASGTPHPLGHAPRRQGSRPTFAPDTTGETIEAPTAKLFHVAIGSGHPFRERGWRVGRVRGATVTRPALRIEQPPGVAEPFDAPEAYAVCDSCLWKQGDYDYTLTSGKRPEGPGGRYVRAGHLHRSKDLAT